MSSKKPTEAKIANVPPFGLRMLPELRDRIKAAADANNRSMNSEIIATLEIAYPEFENAQPGEPMDEDTYSSFVADEDEIWSIIRTVDDLRDKLIRNHQANLRRERSEKSPDPSKGRKG